VTGVAADGDGSGRERIVRTPFEPTGGTVTAAGLFVLAAVGWWWSARMAGEMSMDSEPTGVGGMTGMGGSEAMSVGAFLVAWVAMIAAMMLPAVAPVTKLYRRAATRGQAGPVPLFVGGYLLVWAAVGAPTYVAWGALEEPLAEARPWAGRLAGAVLVVAALWQLSPLKSVCLRHCRSPVSFFLHLRGRVTGPTGALRVGALHGLFCLGCCWALMAVLVAVGTMNLWWMAVLSGLILVEKLAPGGEHVARLTAAAFLAVGTVLLLDPATLSTLT
jgi:predicted metal-binding membrane protein